ncbi:MAG: tetratricopeptide repeat protein, partial [Thermoleophilia bacterium]
AACSLGVLLVRRGDPDGAEAAFRRAYERGHAGGTYNLGRMLALRGDFAAAQRLLHQAAKSSDERVTALATETIDEIRRRPDA